MAVILKLSSSFQKYVNGYDFDKGVIMENAAGKTIRQIAAELSIPLEQITCSIMVNHFPSRQDRVVQDEDLIVLVRLLGGG